RAGVDPALRADGGRRLAGVAARRLAGSTTRAGALSRAARPQCVVELALLRLADGRPGVRRSRAAVARDRRHPRRLLARAPARGCVAAPLPGVGHLRGLPQLLDLADE